MQATIIAAPNTNIIPGGAFSKAIIFINKQYGKVSSRSEAAVQLCNAYSYANFTSLLSMCLKFTVYSSLFLNYFYALLFGTGRSVLLGSHDHGSALCPVARVLGR